MTRDRFTADEIFGRTQIIKSLDNIPQNKPFRLQLSEFAKHWEGRRSRDELELLKEVFNEDYFEDSLFVTDSVSLDFLLSQRFHSKSSDDGSGFVYIYTFENNVLAGKFVHGGFFGFFTNKGYEAEIKIGQTTRNVFKRIYEQVVEAKTALSAPPILLAAFWVPKSGGCENQVHTAFEDKRVTSKNGKPYKLTGVEWFIDKPQDALDSVWKIVLQHRITHQPIEVLGETLISA
jgi:T5orf172 domain